MNLATSRFGEIEIDPDRVITFPDGIIGFRELKRFALIAKKSQALMWLQSLEDSQIAFVVADPFSFEPTYDPILSQEDREALELQEGTDARYLCIVVVPQNPKEMTANLLGPIVINAKRKIGRQVILVDSSYSVKQPILNHRSRVDSSSSSNVLVG
jgi:flagellar assembly factor FliW